MSRCVARGRRRGDSTATARAVAPGGLTTQAEQAHQRPRREHEGGSRETEKEPGRSREGAARATSSRGRLQPAHSPGAKSCGLGARRALDRRLPAALALTDGFTTCREES